MQKKFRDAAMDPVVAAPRPRRRCSPPSAPSGSRSSRPRASSSERRKRDAPLQARRRGQTMSRDRRNILFVMCDSCAGITCRGTGHPRLRTPNIDRLAARGVMFSRAYCQSPICGSSRMSFYTGRYVDSHGAAWNNFPLKVGELTLGDYLRPLGLRTALVGKTHMAADMEGLARLGIDPTSEIGVRVAECGFEPFERDDGLHGEGPAGKYDRASRATTPGCENWATTARTRGRLGQRRRGRARQSALGLAPAQQHPPGAGEGGAFRDAVHDAARAGVHRRRRRRAWCLHLSYIKPHWPCIAPAPYHAMYAAADVPPAVRSEAERRDPHPLLREFMDLRVSRAFSREDVRAAVIPAYMGLITQIDDAIGVLMEAANAWPARIDADRLHLRPRRLSRRPLARREGPLPRPVGEDSADRRRSVAGGRHYARHGVRGAGREHRPGADLRRVCRRRGAGAPPRGARAAAVAARAGAACAGARRWSANTTTR